MSKAEVIQAIGETLPFTATAVGAIGGYVADRFNTRKFDGNAENFSDTLGSKHLQEDSVEPVQESRMDRIKDGVGTMACVGAVAGALVGTAFSFDYKEPHNTAQPVQIVIDRSGKTLVENDGEAAKSIDKITSVFDKKLGEKVDAHVASAGSVQELSPSEVKSVKPQGSARMTEALRGAMNSVYRNAEKTHTVILVDGNKDLPKFKGKNNELTVINVGESSDSVEAYAKESNGQYFEANSSTAEDVADKVAKSIDPKAEDGEVDFRMPLVVGLAMSGIALGGSLGAFADIRRKRKIERQGNNVYQVGV